MPDAIFRVRTPDGVERLAVGDPTAGDDAPERVLPANVTLDALLGAGGPSLDEAVALDGGTLTQGSTLLPPVGTQEIWAAGVTYLRSRDARVEEALEPSPYDRVYEAERPELFFKAPGWRARGTGDVIGIRADSTWDVPEPELTLVLDADLRIVGYTLGNDASSRSIEGENTLYLPQAKTYDGSCAIGPAIVPASAIEPPFTIEMRIIRGDDDVVYDASTSTDQMSRTFEELVAYLGRALTFPVGVFLMTGTGIVPGSGFTLADGDVVAITVDGLGTLENRVRRVGTALSG